jgi:uncharacterized membrane protein
MSASRASSRGRQPAKPQARQGGGQPSGRRSGQPAGQTKRGVAAGAAGPTSKRGATSTAARNGNGAGKSGGSRNGGNGVAVKNDATAGRSASAAPAKSSRLAAPQGWRRFWPTPGSMGWLPFTAFVLSVIGLVDAGYQVWTHFTNHGLLGCGASTDSCVLVQNSVYAWIFGIPVAVYGAAFFVFMVFACSPWAWRFEHPRYARIIWWARLAAVVIGMIFVLYLIYREVISLGQICEYCTSVHIITFLLFGLIVYDASAPKRTELERSPSGRRP